MRLPKIYLLIATVLISGSTCGQENKGGNFVKKGTINENIEWTNTWVVGNNKHDLPKVLVIGDSHVNAYYPVLSDLLKDKTYLSKYTTSKCMGDPVFIEQLTWFLKSNKFDVISINNGLHGIAFTLEQYAGDLRVVYRLFKKYQPKAKLIWVYTTARRKPQRILELDSLNQQVLERNKVISTFAAEKRIPLADLYFISSEHPEYYHHDGIHFKPEGISEEAKKLKDLILKALEPPGASIQNESAAIRRTTDRSIGHKDVVNKP